jgi:transcription initiation protein SPT3
MTREEYVHYSECRQASFTYRKAKRFREWANMSAYTDVKPNDDLIDILGFLSFEMVRTITEAALMVKRAEEMSSANKSGAGKRKRSGSISRDGDQSGEVDHTLDDGKADGHGAGNGESGGDGEGRTGDDNAGSNNGNGNSSSNTGDNSDDNNDEVGLFAPPATGRTPIRAEHVMEGYRRLQHVPRPSWLFRGGLARSRVSII